jgi:hypothetical protein
MQSTGCGDSIRSRNVAGDRGAPFRGQNVEPGMPTTPSRTVRPASVPTWESAYITYSPSPKPSTVPSQAHPQTGVRHPSVPPTWDFIHTRSSESGITESQTLSPNPTPHAKARCFVSPVTRYSSLRHFVTPSLHPFITEASARAVPTASAQTCRGEHSKTSGQGRRFLRFGCRRTCIQPGIRI